MTTEPSTTEHDDTAEFADKLCGFALTAERFMQPDSIAKAFICALFAYGKAKGIPESNIVAALRGYAADLERTEPPAPTVN